MKYRLGIDLGTASIGAVALELDANGKPNGCPWHAVRIFSEPLEKGRAGLKPKKTARREARQQRRQLERRARRIRRVAHLADLLGLDRKTINPHPGAGFPGLRAKAARKEIGLDELLLVLLRLAKKRGYKGEFKTVKDGKSKKVQGGATKLQQEMDALARDQGVDAVTLGEYLHYRNTKQDLPTRLKLEREGVDNLYALRPMLESEFDQIWETQSGFHPVLNASHNGRPVKDHFREAIFYQRPLKSPAAMVGNCPLETNLPRAPRAQPAVQSFRIEKTIGDLRWGVGKRATLLSIDQREVIRKSLNDPGLLRRDGTITFKSIYKQLEKAGCPKPDSFSLNLERASREELKGNTTAVSFDKLSLLDDWDLLDTTTKVQTINFLADLGSPEQLDRDDWYLCILKTNAKPTDKNRMRKFSPELVEFIDTLRGNDKFDRLSKMGFEGGRSSYSIKALTRLTEWMQNPEWDDDPGLEPRIDEDSAVRACYPEHGVRKTLLPRLGAAPQTYDDVVDGALRQLRLVINQCIDQLGTSPSEVIVEASRELGAGAARRNEWENRANQNQKTRKKAAEDIASHGQVATSTKILRYLLWQEQETCCPYCETKIGIREALAGNETQVEHIVPRSLTQVGRKRSELVISHTNCNDKKGEQTPWQAFGHNRIRWDQIEGHAKRFEELGKKNYVKNRPLAMAYFRKAKLLLLKDFEEEVLNDESIAGFADRQLQQSSWIAKAAISWLGTVCPNVFASRGEMTAGLRTAWRLGTVIPEVRYEEGYAVLDTAGKAIAKDDFEKFQAQWEARHQPTDGPLTERRIDKRIDHRHHLIDALTISLTSRGLYQKMARRYIKETEAIRKGDKKRRDWSVEPPLGTVRQVALEIIRECNLSHKPDRTPNGQYFKDTVYGEAENSRLFSRQRLSDLADDKNDLAKTLTNLETIVSQPVKELVISEFKRRIDRGDTPKQALSSPVIYPEYRNDIYRVRCYERRGISGFLVSNNSCIVTHTNRFGEHEKRLVGDSYACIDICQDGSKLKEVSLLDLVAFQRLRTPRVGVVRFFKGDTVIHSKDGRKYLIHQIKAIDGGTVFLSPITESRLIKQLKGSDGKRAISGRGLLKLTLTE